MGDIHVDAKATEKRYDFAHEDGSKDNSRNYCKTETPTTFNIVWFYKANKENFPILWVLMQKVASMDNTGGGCRRDCSATRG